MTKGNWKIDSDRGENGLMFQRWLVCSLRGNRTNGAKGVETHREALVSNPPMPSSSYLSQTPGWKAKSMMRNTRYSVVEMSQSIAATYAVCTQGLASVAKVYMQLPILPHGILRAIDVTRVTIQYTCISRRPSVLESSQPVYSSPEPEINFLLPIANFSFH